MAWFDFGTARVYYEITGQGPPLLYLPGVTEFIANHADLRARLAQSYRVIAADLPGSGRSLPQPRLYHRDYHSEDANAFLALLDQEAPGQKPHLLGFSDGGEVALSMATLAPDRARSVLVWGSAGFIHDPGGQIAAAFHAVVDDPVPAMGAYRDYLVASYGADLARAITQNLAQGLTTIAAAGGNICRDQAHLIPCPVCLFTGQNDWMNPKSLIDALAERIPNAEAHEVADAGHGIHSDRPDWFADRVSDWLARH